MDTEQVKNGMLSIGWAQANITPDMHVMLAGQHHARISEGIKDPVTATALAIEAADASGAADAVVMVSCDLVTISDELRDAVRARVQSALADFDADKLFMGATHTHAAPDARLMTYGKAARSVTDPDRVVDEEQAKNLEKIGAWLKIGQEVMNPADYLDFAAGKIADAVCAAWAKREPSAIAYGMGQAVVGRNRRLHYQNGASIMYGSPATADFSYVEGYEDHTVQAMMTYNRAGKLTGIVVNVPCPSQVTENIFQVSADYWHDTRVELRRRFGDDIFILPQCAPAGDQSPHVLIGRRAEERMWRLKGRENDQNAPRSEIAKRIADAISDMIPYVEKEKDASPTLSHTTCLLELPRRMISEKDVAAALEEARPHKETFTRLVHEIEQNPEIRSKPRWYLDLTRAHRLMERGKNVQKRFALQQSSPNMPIEIHVIRLGEIAFATNPFELYLDYGIRIQELSRATQTFQIQKAGNSGTYLPSQRSVASGGYGSVPASTDIGPEGGDILVQWTVDTINKKFSDS